MLSTSSQFSLHSFFYHVWINSQLGNVCGKEEKTEENIILPLSQNKQQKKKILIQEMKEGDCGSRQKVNKINSFAQNLQRAYQEKNKISKDGWPENTNEVKLRSEETEPLLKEIKTKRYWIFRFFFSWNKLWYFSFMHIFMKYYENTSYHCIDIFQFPVSRERCK